MQEMGLEALLRIENLCEDSQPDERAVCPNAGDWLRLTAFQPIGDLFRLHY